MVHLKEIFDSFQRQEVKYLLCGGIAVNLYGVPRMTADIDLLIEWNELNVERFEAALHEHGYKNNLFFQLKTLIPTTTRLKYYKEKNLIAYSYSSDLFQAISLDVLVETRMEFGACWERREVKYLQDVPVNLLGLDDLIAMKDFANREQDRQDIINLKKYINVIERIKENEGVGFAYTVTMEQMRKHAALSPEAVLQWIEEMATFIYELQTPEERERKYEYKPNKRIPPELLRKDI